MYHIHADDGRILTPPNELELLLKGSFPAFIKILGHIRFFYIADEIWDGKSLLAFRAGSENLAAIRFDDGVFQIAISGKDIAVADETPLNTVYEVLDKAASAGCRRPKEQLALILNDPGQFPCSRRCDMCLGSKNSNKDNFSPGENFGYMNWLCYHGCLPGIDIDRWDGVFACPGCAENKKTIDCKYYPCPTEKGYSCCGDCGEYYTCEVYDDCHYPGQCNLGLTAGEVTSLVIPYASKERFDFYLNGVIYGNSSC
ncbi:MAG: hypothetical protein LBS19_15935 [Clostridiales bacterium]|nr:hypothetical protein [Clostridiales bacterium]